MKFSISTCSFYKYRIRRLLEIKEPFGVEIFYEFGSSEMWNEFLSQSPNINSFSIHAPFVFIDIASPINEEKIFNVLRRPFDLYHRFNGEFYVLHTYGDEANLEDEDSCRRTRDLVTERLFKFNEICKREDVILCAENLCTGKTPLFDQKQYLELFSNIKDLHAVIDVGHAIVAGMNIYELQRMLGGRICAYHLHNNNGKKDLHDRILNGIYDWEEFAAGYRKYTPEAVGVFEYMNEIEIEAYYNDFLFLKGMIERF